MPKVEWDGQGASPWLYAKSAGGTVNIWCCWTEAHEVCVQWGQEGGKLLLARFACEGKNPGKKNETTPEQQAVKEAISKFKKQRKKKYFLTREDALTKLNLKPMLAKGFKDRVSKVVYPAMAQPKLDGRRCFAYRRDGTEEVVLQSRGGDSYTVPHVAADLEATLPEGMLLDGELYIHGASRQYIGSLITRPREESVQLEYHLYDTTMLVDQQTMVTEERILQLVNWHSDNAPYLESCKLVPTCVVNSEAEVYAAHDEYVRVGYEGAIIRLHGGLYKFGYRSNELLKYKLFEDDEFEIISYTTGKPGSDWENVPIFRCRMKTGVEFDVAPKGTAAERYQMLLQAPGLIGKMLTVRYQGFTDDGNLDFPIGIEIRGAEDMS